MKIFAYDSGIGGISVLAPLFQTRNDVDVIYFGDLGNLPYGTKSSKHIRSLVDQNLRWIMETHRGEIHQFVVACNTATAHALDIVEKYCVPRNISVEGVVVPGCRAALSQQSSRIVVLATAGTVASDAYPKELRKMGFGGDIVQQACPLFVPFVEDGVFKGEGIEWAIRRYLKSVLRKGDVAVLGCTHYPFLKKSLQTVFPEVVFVDAGSGFVNFAKADKTFEENKKNTIRFIFTDDGYSEQKIQELFSQFLVAPTIESIRVHRF